MGLSLVATLDCLSAVALGTRVPGVVLDTNEDIGSIVDDVGSCSITELRFWRWRSYGWKKRDTNTKNNSQILMNKSINSKHDRKTDIKYPKPLLLSDSANAAWMRN